MVSLFSIFFTKRINIELKKNDGSFFSTAKTDHFIFDNQTLSLSANHVFSGIDKGSVLYTKQQPLRIKFEPLESEGEFEVNTLQFIPINQFFAEKYMMNELLHKQNGITGRELKVKVSDNAKKSNISFMRSLFLKYHDK